MGITRARTCVMCVFSNRPYSSYGKNTPLTVATSTADACGCRICLLQPLHAYSFRRKGSIPRTAVDKRLRFARRRATHDGRRTDDTGRKHKKCRRKTAWTARGGAGRANADGSRARICAADRPATDAQRHGMPPEARKRPSTPSQAIGRAFSRPKAAEGRKGRSCASGAAWPWACRRRSCRHGLGMVCRWTACRPVLRMPDASGMSVGRPVGDIGRLKRRFSGAIL